ncbi:L-asparaginase isoform X4 [Eurytemora carolleeae]|uniref:L-asparaginase isoform X4 n=1 Tax=Eurytemora carolleeae TaxID=1294199 RepID=UPI000C760315|nr:L-asparaginase isoform X4 [Eurytemora carolleeae]|eukprot:XP_023340125.1 L-asparaginase-like isoform X4 [Eurytemora affinis]
MKRVVYSIYEYDPILDSSNMTMDDWIQIASDIKSSYHMFDGFVILHGTDTLAYTSSALSFMLENLGKTIIVTGSQIPCFETRSDGRDNIVGALILAGNYCIPEVSVYFNHKLMRGNRTVKVSSGSLHAFESPNLPPLATVGINISVDYRSLWKSGKIKALNVQANLCRDVVLLRLFPSISTETIKHFLTPPIKGVVLQCYGAGNMPSNRKDIIAAIESATKQGVIVVSCTQCSHGAVSGEYETGRALMNAGVIPSSDITPEAALTKLSYVLAKSELSHEEKRKVMESSIRGEMTVQFEVVNPRTLEMQTNETNQLDLIDQVARAMNLTSGEEIDNLNSILFPSLLCSVVYLGDTSRLAVLEENQPDFSAPDYSGKTGLHIAAALGNDSMVEWLLERGANVHARDMNNDTPLLVAARAGKESTVKVLAQCGGAHGLTLSELGDLMVLEAGQGHIEQLRCLLQAGASPDICSVINGNTALHAAIEGNHLSVCELLLSVGGSVDIPNIYGYTAKHISTLLHREHLLKIERKMTNGNNS